MTIKFKLVKVSDQGVQFGNAWYSHESITGYSANQLNQGNCCVTGGAYMKWLSEQTTPQPIYDEAKERKLFQSFAVNRRGGYGNLPFFVFARKENGEYMDGTSELAWEGWKACAQSRAKAGEVGDE